MTGNPGGIRCGASSLPYPPDVLGAFAYGSAIRKLLRGGIPGIMGGDTGGPSAPQHIQCGGRLSGLTLVSGDGRASGRSGWEWTGGTTPK